MELRHLRYFRAIGREQHFGRAAITLRVAQPALTRQIRDLEAELGVELFERLPRGVRLSSVGRAFLDEVEEILNHVDRAVDRARKMGSGHLGTIRVGLSEIAASYDFISRGLRYFRENEPMVALDLRSIGSMNQIAAIKDGLLDVGIVYDVHLAGAEEGLETAVLGAGETMLAVHESHRLAGRASVKMADIANEPVLGPARKTAPSYYDQLMAACVESGSAPHFVQECATNSILFSLVAVGLGVGFVTVATPVSPGHDIQLIPISDLHLNFQVVLVWRDRDRSAALRCFVDAMRQHADAPPVIPAG